MFTSAAVVITAVPPSFSAISSVSSFAPPICPDKTLITNLALSSMTNTAGSIFLSLMYGEIKRTTAPNEKIQTSASLVLKSSAILLDVGSEYHSICVSLSENLEGA